MKKAPIAYALAFLVIGACRFDPSGFSQGDFNNQDSAHHDAHLSSLDHELSHLESAVALKDDLENEVKLPPDDTSVVVLDQGQTDHPAQGCQQGEKILLSADFEGKALPSGWFIEQAQGQGKVEIDKQGARQGKSGLVFNPQTGDCKIIGTAQTVFRLVLPLIEHEPKCKEIRLSFFFKNLDLEVIQGDGFFVDSRKPGAQWTERMNVMAQPGAYKTPSDWISIALNIPLQGSLEIGLRHQSQCNNDLAAIDDLSITLLP